jgi:hypothetical protein
MNLISSEKAVFVELKRYRTVDPPSARARGYLRSPKPILKGKIQSKVRYPPRIVPGKLGPWRKFVVRIIQFQLRVCMQKPNRENPSITGTKNKPTFYGTPKIERDGCIDVDDIVACINDEHWITVPSYVLLRWKLCKRTGKPILCQTRGERATTDA